MSSQKTTVNKELYEKYSKLIDQLYEFRDKYYILNPKSNNESRIADLNKKLDEILNELDNIREEFNSQSNYLLLIGRANNVLPEYNQKAFDALSKAVKLDAKCYEAWNYLGECYWKNRDFEASRNCFLKSLNIEKNKHSLRGLSMVTRQLANRRAQNVADVSENSNSNNKENSTNQQATVNDPNTLIDESVTYAKEAVQLDIKDGMSWYILANSYLAQFFSGQHKSELIKHCISAYKFALKDEQASLQSDLYFNKSMISLYEEDWNDVLYCLDRTLQLDPNWKEPYDTLVGVLDYLTQIQESIDAKGKLKAKKFQSLISGLSESDAGGYSAALTNSTSTQNETDENENKKNLKMSLVTLKDLNKGVNRNKLLIGKVISGMPKRNFDMICFTCCIADQNGDCVGLTIYNLVQGEGVIIGDSIAIPEPYLEQFDFNYKPSESLNNNEYELKNEYKFKFNSIRVSYPHILVVNGKKWTKDKVSTAKFVPTVLDD